MRGCDHSIRVEVDGRKFRVDYDADGNVIRIKERKIKTAGVYEVSYWVATSHRAPEGSRPARIMAAAAEKQRQP